MKRPDPATARADFDRNAFLVLLFVLTVAFAWIVWPYYGGVFWGAVLALLFSPAVLMLDEPSAGLDPVSAGLLKDRMRAERDAGTTVILTSHVLSEIDELADDVAFLADGRIRFAGPVHDLKVATRQFTLERAIAHVLLHGVEVAA